MDCVMINRLIPTLTRAILILTLILLTAAHPWNGRASSLPPPSPLEHALHSSAVFRGEILKLQTLVDSDDGHCYTLAFVRVDEAFKGALPAIVRLKHRGGAVNGEGEISDLLPDLRVGEERLFFVALRPDESAYALYGNESALKLAPPYLNFKTTVTTYEGDSALSFLRSHPASGLSAGANLVPLGVSAQALQDSASPASTGTISLFALPSSHATNLLVDAASGLPARLTAPDRGEPIPYLVDADYLPAGMTTNQALQAVQDALAAWASATGVKYNYLGLQSFGMAAPNVTNVDGVLRIQLHDHYAYIGGTNGAGSVLGTGLQYFSLSILTNTTWTSGGNVNGNDFALTTHSAILMVHTNTFFTNTANFAEVLCHEVGHTLGLGHSSSSSTETNPLLNGAIMYYLAHGNGGGAVLGAWDQSVVQQVQPVTNIPPYMYPRVMHVVTSVSSINDSSVNTTQLRAYSLENKSLVISTNNDNTNSGHFSLTGSNLHYTANAAYSDVTYNPAFSTSLGNIYARCSDGTNASPYVLARVTSFGFDGFAEGIPSAWRITYFGSPNPSSGANHHANNDADGDGYSNLLEYQMGSNPTDPLSNLRITSITSSNFHFQAAPYGLYEVQASTNLTNWQRAMNPLIPTNSDATVNISTRDNVQRYFRVIRVP